jgi:hypothetical protein
MRVLFGSGHIRGSGSLAFGVSRRDELPEIHDRFVGVSNEMNGHAHGVVCASETCLVAEGHLGRLAPDDASAKRGVKAESSLREG